MCTLREILRYVTKKYRLLVGHSFAKLPSASVLLYKLALYESCVKASATLQGNEIRDSEEKSSNLIPKRFTALIFHEISKNLCFMKNGCCSITPSPAIHLLHFNDLWHHRNVFELQKMQVAQTNVHS